MQWRFSVSPSAASPTGLKRPPSNQSLSALAAKHHRYSAGQPVLAAAGQPGSGSGAAAPAAAPPPLAVSPGQIDVAAVAAKHGWDLQQRNDFSGDRQVRWVPVASIRRPLQGTRANDPEKVAALMRSIQEVGLQEPIDVLEVDGSIWGFSGCHRYEAHMRLGKEQILCRVRKATPQVLRMHMM